MGGIPITESISSNLQLASGQIRRVNVVHQKPMVMRVWLCCIRQYWRMAVFFSTVGAPCYPLSRLRTHVVPGSGSALLIGAVVYQCDIMRLGSIYDSRLSRNSLSSVNAASKSARCSKLSSGLWVFFGLNPGRRKGSKIILRRL